MKKIILSLALTLSVSFAYSINELKLTKEQLWQNMEKEVASWGDALGMPIDPEIKKAVIVLNLLGFKTEQSCEGHIDWGLPYSWISFDTSDKEIETLMNTRLEISNKIDKKESEIQKKYPDLSAGEALRKEDSEELYAMYRERHPTNDKLHKLQKLKLVPLKNLITDFYKNHKIDPDKMIAFGELERIYSLGGEWQIVRDESEKLIKLKEYQQEMKLFADFLTDYYFKTYVIPTQVE